MRSPLIVLSLLPFVLIGASYGQEYLQVEGNVGYEKNKETVVRLNEMDPLSNTVEKYVVDGLVYGVKIEAGTPTVFLVGKLKSDSEGNQLKSGGVGKRWSGSPNEFDNVVADLETVMSYTQEDERALETAISKMAARSIDFRVKGLATFGNKDTGEAAGSFGAEFLYSGVFKVQEDMKKEYKEFGQVEYNKASGILSGLTFFAGYKDFLLEVGMKYKNYKIKIPSSLSGESRVLKVNTESFSGRISKRIVKGIKLSIFAISDEYEKHNLIKGTLPSINDGPRTPYELDLVTMSERSTIGANIEIPFRIGSGSAKSK